MVWTGPSAQAGDFEGAAVQEELMPSTEPRFLLVLTGEVRLDEGQADEWRAWFSSIAHLIRDRGDPLGASATINPDGTIVEGGRSRLTGFVVISAPSFAEAVNAAKSCPVLAVGGNVEVYEARE